MNIIKSKITYKVPPTENVLELIRNGLTKHSKHIILIDGENDIKWTGEELQHVILRLTKYLIDDCGVKKGDVCSLYLDESATAAIMILSIIATGGICKFIPKTSPKDLYSTAKVAKSRFVISSKQLLPSLHAEFAGKSEKVCFVSIDHPYEDCKNMIHLFAKDSKGMESNFDELIKHLDIDADKDFAVIQFSSGTTGKPKRIPRTHKNLCHLVASVNDDELVNLKPGVTIGGNLYLAFRPGIWALLASINWGNTLVVYGWKSSHLKMIEKYRINILFISVFGMINMADRELPNRCNFDVSSLREILTQGAKIVDPSLPERFVNELNLSSLRQGFGMTESGWVFLIEKCEAKDNYLTVGHVVPGTEAIVINRDTSQRLGPNERGELALRGPQIFPGYLSDEPGGFNKADFTEDGWFRTGDEVYYTEDGLFYIVGRYKELMTFENFERFYPDQIEAVLSDLPSIEAACVVKVPGQNDELYDTARAYIIVEPNSNLSEQAISNHLQSNYPLIKLQGGIRIVETFPKLSNGKINKQALKDMA